MPPAPPVRGIADKLPENMRSTDPIVHIVQPIRVIQPVQTVIVRTPEVIREEPETIRPELRNNSPETIQNNSKRIESELLPRIELEKPRQSIQFAPYKKVGKIVGRQRKYDEEGERGEIPIREIVVYRHVKGRHYPTLSKDMQRWYEFFYFTAPLAGEKPFNANTTFEQHIEAYKRGQKWIDAYEDKQFEDEEANNSIDAVENSRIVDLQARRTGTR